MIEHLILAALAGWRISHLFVNENGPGKIFSRIRMACGVPDRPGVIHPVPFLGELISCVLCASVWFVAAAWLFGAYVSWVPVAVVAAMGVALWLEFNTED